VTAPLPLAELTDAVVQSRPARSLNNEVVLYGLAALLMLCPLAFGCVEPWAIFILESVSVVLFAIWVVGQVLSSQVNVLWNSIFPPTAAFAGLVCIQVLPGFSAYRHATFSGLLLYVAYGLVSFLVTQCLTRTRHLRTLTTSLVIYGSALAMFAVLQSLSSPNKLYWFRTPHFGGWIYGPYVNHNHYAGLMEMLVPIALVFAFSRYAHGRERWAAASAAALMGATIFLSGSRGGMAALGVQIAIFLGFLFKERSGGRAAFLMAGFLLLSLALVTWIGGSQVADRLSTLADHRSELSGDLRLSVDRDALRMFSKRPILGWGLGTFEDVYPQFRSFYTNFRVDKAHNDYLQLLTETGALGFSLMLWFLVAALRPALRKTRKWPSDVNGAVSVAVILGISGILVHSFVDFNLEIPANALLFYTLCTVAAMEPRFANYRREHAKHEVDSTSV